MNKKSPARISAAIVWPDWATRKRKKPVETLSDSYARQWYRIIIEGQHFELHPTERDGYCGCTEQSDARYILSASNSHAVHVTNLENSAYNSALRQALDHAGYSYYFSVTLQRELGWFETSFVVTFPSDEIALQWAWQYGQPAVVKWNNHCLHVLPVLGEEILPFHSVCELTAIARKECPMKSLERNQMCTPHGGPWTSSSLSALVAWKEHRAAILQLLGCDICSNGSEQLPSKIVTTNVEDWLGDRGTLVANRFGGYVC